MKLRRSLWLVPVLLCISFWKVKQRLNRKEKIYEPQQLDKVLRVQRIWQREAGVNRPNSACGPATAAMIVQYLARINEKDLAETSQVAIVNQLYDEIGTLPWGTSAKRWQKGFLRYVRATFSNDQWDVHLGRGGGQFDAYCQSIDEQMPVVLRFTLNNSAHAFASHHYTLGVGYSVKNDERKVDVLDADGGKLNKRIHWIDWHENERYIKMLRIHRTGS